MTPQDWVNSKFTVSDLNNNTVEYPFRGEDGHTYFGEGRLIAVSQGNLMRVRIAREIGIAKDASSVSVKAFIIPGCDAPKLVKNPPGSKCDFSIKAL